MIKYYYTFVITKGQINYYENSFYKIDKIYFRNRKLHRDNGPACEWSDGEIAWFKDGKRHRDDGPAVELPKGYSMEFTNGYKEWWKEGVFIKYNAD